jgi:L-lactate utilization protein LutB
MENNIAWYREKQVERTIKNLNKRNMEGYYIKDKKQLLLKLNELVTEGSIVGVGDSMTLFETGVIDFLRSGKFEFLDKYKEGLSSENKKEIYIKNFSADSFLCSTNAITEDGELYNIDGNGSRVAPMIYGPKQVIIVAGINKIVKNLDEAQIRVRQYAAPIDARRLNKDTPCTKVGYCVNCSSSNRICNDFVTITGQFIKGRIKVLIVDDCLGY